MTDSTYGHLEEAPQGFILEKDQPQPYTLAPLIMAVDNVVDLEFCRMMRDYMDKEYALNPGVTHTQRTAFMAPSRPPMVAIMRKLFFELISGYVEPYFNASVEWWEQPQLLRYTVGGHYGVHADAENSGKNQPNPDWKRTHNRDISIILYLNNDFTGGLLHFPDHDLKVKPQPGLLLAFPSHHGYRHAALPTESGVRYVIVSWMAILGAERIKQPVKNVVHMDEVRKGFSA